MEVATSIEKITVEDCKKMYFIDTDDAPHLELMEGQIIQRSSPSPLHQRILRKLMVLLDLHVNTNNLGEIFCSPIDVLLDNYNQLIPDLLFISNEQKKIVTKDGIKGSPALVIEIISPSSVMRDRVHKKRIYERNGVKEFWLVYPEYEEIEIFELKDGKYDLYSTATKDEGELQSSLLKDLKLDLKEIF